MFKFIKNLFSGNKEELKSNIKEEKFEKSNEIITAKDSFIKERESNKIDTNKMLIDNLVDQLDYVHKDPETKILKRIEAYKNLGELGSKAGIAIPVLIRKTFSSNKRESLSAIDALEGINKKWTDTSYAKEEIPFLIDKLKKDQVIANKSSRILLEIGNSAIEELVTKINQEEHNEPYLEYNIIKVINEYNNPKYIEDIFPVLKDRLSKKENTQLLEVVTDTLTNNEKIDEETILLAINLLNDCKTQNLKEKLVSLLGLQINKTDLVIVPLFKCLTDDNSIMRSNCIKSLAKTNHDILDKLCLTVLEGKGKTNDDDLKKIFEKVDFWINSDIESYKTSARRFYDNISWYNLELNKDLKKPMVLLNSVLEIYSIKKTNSSKLFEKFILICKETPNSIAKSLSINILSNFDKNKDISIPFIMNYLDHDSEKVREASIESLSILDPNWVQNPINQKRINEIIDNFSESNNDSSISTLIEIGKDSIPLLINRLENAENRIMQESIIKVLDNLGTNVNTSIPNLLKIQEQFKNAHTIKAIKELIEKLEKKS